LLKYDEAQVRYHCQLLHHVAGRACVDGKLILAAYGKADDGETALPAVVKHFAIGDSDEMVAAAMQFEGTRYNVYAPWSIMPSDLPDGAKGTKKQVARALALVIDGDADKGKPAPQPLVPADYVVQTSAGNFQHFHVLDRALDGVEAVQFAESMERATGADCAGDTSHVWRVPGTTNVTDRTKWERGRPKFETVRIHKSWDGASFADTGKMRAILQPHWEKPRTERVVTVARPKQYDNDPAKVEAFFVRLRDAGYFDAGPEARKRYTRAAKALSYDLGDVGRDIWERIVCWQGEREGDGIPATQDEKDIRWKDCSSLKPGANPLTLGTFKDDVHKALGWPKAQMHTARDKAAGEMFADVVSTLPPGVVPMIGAGARQAQIVAPEYSEIEIADRFANDYASTIRFVTTRRSWVYWTGKRWCADETDYVLDMARRHCRSEAGLCASTPGNTVAQARSINSNKTVNAIVKLAGVDQRIASRAVDWDADPWLLGTPDGIVDLRTGTLRPAQPDDRITKVTAVAPGGDCPTWLKFLNRATNGDAEMQAYLQRIAGYCLTGDVSEQALFFLDGKGGNGKGVFVNTLQNILKDYAKPTAIETLTASNSDRHPTDIADLLGARLVTCSETERGKRWAESRIKQMTGGDQLSARFTGKDFFAFTPTFKIVVSGNTKPSLRADDAMRRRFQVVPFRVTIPKDEQDKKLSGKLRREWSGILAWAVAGAISWQRDGLNPPASVNSATKDYMDDESEDTLSMWIAECCDTSDPEARTPLGELHNSYDAFARAAGERDIMSRVRLGKALGELGYQPARTGKEGRQRVGIKKRERSGAHAITPPFPSVGLPVVGVGR
jgi:putative DNA primase/helicase